MATKASVIREGAVQHMAGFDCEGGSLATPQNSSDGRYKKYAVAGSMLALFGVSAVFGYCALGPLLQGTVVPGGHGHTLGKAAYAGGGMPVNRRQALGKAAAAAGLAGLGTMPQPAAARPGQFGKLSLFGQEPISSPYQAGGPQAGKDATFGYKKSEGEILSKDYQKDVEREKAAFAVSEEIIRAQGANIDKKIWWLARDNLRGQAYTMKANMKAITYVSKDPFASTKAYDKFWSQVNKVDQACDLKKIEPAQTEYVKAIEALDAYKQIAF